MSRAVLKIVLTNRYTVRLGAFSAYFRISEDIEINAEVFSLMSGLNRMGVFVQCAESMGRLFGGCDMLCVERFFNNNFLRELWKKTSAILIKEKYHFVEEV